VGGFLRSGFAHCCGSQNRGPPEINIDRDGAIYGITVEHASKRAEISTFSYEQNAA